MKLVKIEEIITRSNNKYYSELKSTSLNEIIDNLNANMAHRNIIDYDEVNYFKGEISISVIDDLLMPALVNNANVKYRMMNLKLVNSISDFFELLTQCYRKQYENFRFILRHEYTMHYVTVDCKVKGNKMSILLFEPVIPYSSLEIPSNIQDFIKNNVIIGVDIFFAHIAMDIQRSNVDCGMFSLALAKKLCKHSDYIEAIHIDNINKRVSFDFFDERNRPSSYIIDKYLPPPFYKHTQGFTRVKNYFSVNSSQNEYIVNKKGENLQQRQSKHNLKVIDKVINESIYYKRITEYESLLAYYQN